MPKMPSNLAAMKATPGSLVASAKVWPGTVRSPIVSTSVDRKPDSAPVPYWMANAVPLGA